MTADEIKKLLNLSPHPCEGGWYVRTYEASEPIPAAALPAAEYDGPRLTGTAIYYLLEPDTFSELHRLKSDEIFHHYAGDAVEMLQLAAGDDGRRVVLGKDLAAGERPQVIVPRGVWQGSRLVAGGTWALLGCTVSPGFEFADYEAGHADELCGQWPAWADFIVNLSQKNSRK